MDKRMIAAGVAVALALPGGVAGTAVAKKPNPKSPSQACRALRTANEAAFKAEFKNFGKCVSQHAKAKTRTPSAIRAQKNAARTCFEAREADASAFSAKWGTGRNGFGKCVSTTARQRST